MLAEQFLINSWFVIETFEVPFRDKLDEVLVPFLVFTENNQMMRAAAGGIAIEPAGFRDVHLAANDRLDTVLGRGFVESDCAKKIPMIGHSHRRHFVFGSSPGQRVVIAGSIEKTETRMQMEMNER